MTYKQALEEFNAVLSQQETEDEDTAFQNTLEYFYNRALAAQNLDDICDAIEIMLAPAMEAINE
jgi:hypothetical protein